MQRSSKLNALLVVLTVALLVPAAGAARTRLIISETLDPPSVAVVSQSATVEAPSAPLAGCSSGAHTLSHFGDRVYPEMGNGGYTSLHTDVTMNYDAPSNMFLTGTKVDLRVRSTQCLTDLSFDFERTNNSTAGGTGPNMSVNAVSINGTPAAWTFVQPTYPGDPNGQNDPDLDAHAVSNQNPVSATNPNPPACSPQTNGNTQNGTQCPANKLVVMPSAEIPMGTIFTVTIEYTGRPGVHVDGDGSTEGWFRVNTTAAPNDGAFVTTEPVGTDSWMPLNNHPSAKPTYDFYDTTNIGKTAVANGELVGTTPPTGTTFVPVSPTSVNPPDGNFAGGSWTWHWHSPEPISNYLVENSIGSYDLTARTSPTSGIQYFQALASGLTAARKTAIKVNLDQQEDILEFQRQFAGPYPFTTAGIVVALPSVGFAEEMQTKITFGNGATSTPSLGTINHENFHQWFGDNVAEGAFNLTFWKEGFATIGEYLNTARTAAGGGSSGPAFETSLINRFNTNYGTTSGTFWTSAPSNPTVGNLFTSNFTYVRPGTSYLALWQALGRERMISAMKDIQSTYGGASITEAQLEDVFREWLPVPSASCNARLDQFFPQWWDTSYPAGGVATTNKPAITGPGLNGTGFVCAQVSPAAPDGQNGWYTSDVSITWHGYGAPAVNKTGCVDETVATDGTFTRSCSVTTTAAPILISGAVSETFKRDATDPNIELLTPPDGAIYRQGASIHADYSCDDDTSGPDGCSGDVADGDDIDTSTLGWHTFKVEAKDVAGNTSEVSHSYYVTPTDSSNPQAWGKVKVSPGASLRVGYDFTIPGKHPATTVKWVDGQVEFAYTCASGGGSGSIVVAIQNRSYDVASKGPAWYPSGDAKDPSVYQGSRTVPDVCGGAQILLGKATFVSGILASQRVKLNYRWHFSAAGGGGGWSGTYGVTPDLIP